MNSGQYGHERSVTTMTPERLNELADEIQSADEYELLQGDLLECVIIALRESAQALICAKAEPIATIRKLANGQHDIAYKTADLNNLSVGTKLYAEPQVSQSPSPIDERAEFEKWINAQDDQEPMPVLVYKAWHAARKLSAPEVVSKTTDTVVPDELKVSLLSAACEAPSESYAYVKGWNDCRAAMQANCDAMLKGEK